MKQAFHSPLESDDLTLPIGYSSLDAIRCNEFHGLSGKQGNKPSKIQYPPNPSQLKSSQKTVKRQQPYLESYHPLPCKAHSYATTGFDYRKLMYLDVYF